MYTHSFMRFVDLPAEGDILLRLPGQLRTTSTVSTPTDLNCFSTTENIRLLSDFF